mmetsp:Transcript_25335/g.55124  ORF Transcript_25335/g.55124 Transcript_25335/m.55124 type:complete len:274 (-) Transcript_25335:2264-3085(-)
MGEVTQSFQPLRTMLVMADEWACDSAFGGCMTASKTGLRTPLGSTLRTSPATWSNSPAAGSSGLPVVVMESGSSPRVRAFQSCTVQIERPLSATDDTEASGTVRKSTKASLARSRKSRFRTTTAGIPMGGSGSPPCAMLTLLSFAEALGPSASSSRAANRFLLRSFFRLPPRPFSGCCCCCCCCCCSCCCCFATAMPPLMKSRLSGFATRPAAWFPSPTRLPKIWTASLEMLTAGVACTSSSISLPFGTTVGPVHQHRWRNCLKLSSIGCTTS